MGRGLWWLPSSRRIGFASWRRLAGSSWAVPCLLCCLLVLSVVSASASASASQSTSLVSSRATTTSEDELVGFAALSSSKSLLLVPSKNSTTNKIATPANVPASTATVLASNSTASTTSTNSTNSNLQSNQTKTELQHQNTWVLGIVTCALVCLALCLRLTLAQLHRQKRTATKHVHANVQVVTHALEVSLLVLIWYAISIGMTLFNRWFLRDFAHTGFPFSTTMTCLNMFTKFCLSRLVDACSERKIKPLATHVYWKLAVPIGLCTAIDIMLSNYSLFYVTVTFYTIVKSGGNVWNLLFSILLGHQKASWALFSVIVLISSGIALGSFGSTEFSYHGLWLVLLASIIGTLKWVLTQSLLRDMDPGSNRIIGVVYYISPASALGLVPIVLATEIKPLVQSRFIENAQLGLLSLALILCGGCLAFSLIFIEIMLVKKTSALSLGIAGSFKDVTQVLLAVLLFHDRLSVVNVIGLVVATCGMLMYTILKNFQAQQDSTSGSSTNGSNPPAPRSGKYAPLPTTNRYDLEYSAVSNDDAADGDLDTSIGSGDEPQVQEAIQVQEIRIESRPLARSYFETQLKRRESKDFECDVPLGPQIV